MLVLIEKLIKAKNNPNDKPKELYSFYECGSENTPFFVVSLEELVEIKRLIDSFFVSEGKDLWVSIRNEYFSKGKISAIKKYRLHTGASLKEAITEIEGKIATWQDELE